MYGTGQGIPSGDGTVRPTGIGKMRLVRPPASGASSMVKSWVKIRDSFVDMFSLVRVMVTVRGRIELELELVRVMVRDVTRHRCTGHVSGG